jgi:hypothetical protein
MDTTAARLLHDDDLRTSDSEVAATVLAGRERAARQIRVVLARVYGRPDMATRPQWQVLPCLTDVGTIGILDIARGTAWDTGVVADTGVADLGVDDAVYAGANGIAGDVRIDGDLVQRDGATPGSPLRMPAGWRQIALPTWRAGDVVPADYRPDQWIRPRLVTAGLMTCYGSLGAVEDGDYLMQAHGWDARWPWGVPEWIDGVSVSVVDWIAKAGRGRATCRPRGTEAEESAAVAAAYPSLLAAITKAMRAHASDEITYRGRPWLRPDERQSLAGAADTLTLDIEQLRAVRDEYTRIGNRSDWAYTGTVRAMLDALIEALAADTAWSAADALKRWSDSLPESTMQALGLSREVD